MFSGAKELIGEPPFASLCGPDTRQLQEAFVDIQEVCLASSVELAVEGAHRRIHTKLCDASKPASICAALHRSQTIERYKADEFVQSLLGRTWKSHSWLADLLELPPSEAQRMSLAEAHATVYSYSWVEQFADTSDMSASIGEWFKETNKRRKKDVVITPVVSMAIAYFKWALCPRRTYSVDAVVFDMARAGNIQDALVPVAAPTCQSIVDAFQSIDQAGEASGADTDACQRPIDYLHGRPAQRSRITQWERVGPVAHVELRAGVD